MSAGAFRTHVSKRKSTHHKQRIHLGSEIYNIDNITAMTSRRHIKNHRKRKH
ncbi:hypothetical protein [Pseudomonas sp. Q11]|uniref:hypothetical protein n=1 Tax=Pseudomonas sp. Q11 TaxID=2968470 RepID=UPI0035254D1E